VRPLHAEFILRFVADEGTKHIIDIDSTRLVFLENIAKFRTSYSLSMRKMVPIGKDIFSFGSNSLVLSFVYILVDSNITKNTFISCLWQSWVITSLRTTHRVIWLLVGEREYGAV
jgi:hypothetical protein